MESEVHCGTWQEFFCVPVDLKEQILESISPGGSLSYEELFLTVLESCNVPPNKELRRSERI